MKIDFVTELSQDLIEYLTTLESDELVEDDYGNLRYIGARILTIMSMSSKNDYVFCIFLGNVFDGYTINNMIVRPVVYLDSKVKVEGSKDGAIENAFLLK